MFSYNKKKKYAVNLFCPICKEDISFNIPEDFMHAEHKRYPFTYRYIHGHPTHSITLYIDKNHDIRGKEFGDSITFSDELMDRIFTIKNIKSQEDTQKILGSIINTFTVVIDARVPENEIIHYDVGTKLGKKLEPLFKSTEYNDIFYEFAGFWKKNGFGQIDELEITKKSTTFNVYECFECSHMPNMGRTVCKLDEGFLTTVLETKFKNKFEVKEIECYASGYDHCRFEIKRI